LDPTPIKLPGPVSPEWPTPPPPLPLLSQTSSITPITTLTTRTPLVFPEPWTDAPASPQWRHAALDPTPIKLPGPVSPEWPTPPPPLPLLSQTSSGIPITTLLTMRPLVSVVAIPTDARHTPPKENAASRRIPIKPPEPVSPEWPLHLPQHPPLLMTSSGSPIGPKHGPMVCASPEPPHQVDTPLHLKPSVASMPMPDRLLEHALPTWTALPLPLPSPSPIWCSIPFTPEIGLRDTATMIPTKHRLLDPSESPSSPLKRNAATYTSRTSPEGSARPVYLSKDPWLPPLHPFTFILSGEVVSTKVAV